MSDKRFRIAILDDFEKLADTVPAYEKLNARADVTILRERLDSPEKIERTLKEIDALLLMRERTYFSDNEYNRLPNLKLISQTGRTSRHLDLPSATRRGIAVTGTPADNGTSTKELTIALILALMRKIPEIDRRMREESWPPVAGRLLEGKTAGVLGFGRIGEEGEDDLGPRRANETGKAGSIANIEEVASAKVRDFGFGKKIWRRQRRQADAGHFCSKLMQRKREP